MLSAIARKIMTTLVPRTAAIWLPVPSFGLTGCEGTTCNQNKHASNEEAGVHQPDMHVLVGLGEVEQGREVPDDHCHVEQGHGDPAGCRGTVPAPAAAGPSPPAGPIAWPGAST